MSERSEMGRSDAQLKADPVIVQDENQGALDGVGERAVIAETDENRRRLDPETGECLTCQPPIGRHDVPPHEWICDACLTSFQRWLRSLVVS